MTPTRYTVETVGIFTIHKLGCAHTQMAGDACRFEMSATTVEALKADLFDEFQCDINVAPCVSATSEEREFYDNLHDMTPTDVGHDDPKEAW